ncbi:MAG: glycosyltransferase [Phycisphaeraceae bacterium]
MTDVMSEDIATATLAAPAIASAARATTQRPCVRGKFLFVEDAKFYVRGATYGPFEPEPESSPYPGSEYHTPEAVYRDFAMMAAAGLNTIRVYTVPPRWLLDIAAAHGLRVFIGIPWEQHVLFLDSRKRRRAIEQRVREGVRQCAGHPAVLAYTVGNEIPADIVRWYGRRRVERFLDRLYRAAKAEDATALVTYVNFPTTEYLQLPFLDFVSFNVYLEDPQTMRGYLNRLQNLAGQQPLVMGEIGLDSQRNGVNQQAATLDWQVRTCFAAGCAGAFVFAWTDEWYRGGHAIDDWDFGLTDRQRSPKPALEAVTDVFEQTPFARDRDWPRVSVVVCTYNGAATLGETCRALVKVDYPDFEVIVVNDGSTNHTADVLREAVAEVGEQVPFRVIDVPNGGLSRARNIGMEAATGEIVAYLDDDAYPDPHWLQYLADMFMTTEVVGVGGPNLPVPEDGLVAECVSWAPGGPNHVLMTDTMAEHIPGCNMAFRKTALLAIGGFDEQFRIAGDDVDLCWRLQERDGMIGFHPSAMVWHHRRGTVRGYLRQQTNYGRAEAMLEHKWPQKYNRFGHVAWAGQLYGDGCTLPLFLRRSRVYHGVWGTQLFQSLYTRKPGMLRSLPLMPEWYLLTVTAMLVALPGILWKPVMFLVPLAVMVIGIPVAQASISATQARLDWRHALSTRLRRRGLIALLHLLQPVVRLKGRLVQGLTPWRRPGVGIGGRKLALPRPRQTGIWSQQWQSGETRLRQLETALHRVGGCSVRGGAFNRWDLEIRGGLFGSVRLIMAIEEHGHGQMVRLRSWPAIGRYTSMSIVGLLLLAVGAVFNWQIGACILLLSICACLTVRTVGDCASATAAYLDCLKPPDEA